MKEWITITGNYREVLTPKVISLKVTFPLKNIQRLERLENTDKVNYTCVISEGEDGFDLIITQEEYERIKAILTYKEPKTTIVEMPKPNSPLDDIKTLGSK
jgi:hypothetical protein